MGSAIKGHAKSSNNSSSSAMMTIFAMAFLLTVALGGATTHYRKANNRMEHKLMIVKRQMKTGRFRNGAPLPDGEEAEEEARYITTTATTTPTRKSLPKRPSAPR
jgi:hypothetical protein